MSTVTVTVAVLIRPIATMQLPLSDRKCRRRHSRSSGGGAEACCLLATAEGQPL